MGCIYGQNHGAMTLVTYMEPDGGDFTRKFINAGQTCIAPDYLLVHREIKTELIDRLKYFIHRFYGADPRQSADYPRIINEKHFQRSKFCVLSPTNVGHFYTLTVFCSSRRLD